MTTSFSIQSQMPEPPRIKSVAELERCFAVDVGWGPDWKSNMAARTIFDHMLAASQWVTPDHIILDVSAGQMQYKPFYDHGNYMAMDAAIGDVNWDYTKLDIIGDAMHLPIRAACIDTCLNFTSLEHYPNPNQFFSEVSRILKPGGRLYLFAPCVYLEHQQPYDFGRYTRFGLNNMCLQNGLNVLKLQPTNSILHTAITLLTWARDDVKKIRDQGHVVEQMNQIIANLTATFKVYDDALKDFLLVNFPNESVFYQAPLQYCLVAEKPGTLVTRPHDRSRRAILNEILACPSEKKPIEWDGVSAEVCATGAHRKYPVINGVPRFMS